MTGAKLAERRKKLGLSQVTLAEKLGTSANTVARWEREEMKIQNPVMLGLALSAIEESQKMINKWIASGYDTLALSANGYVYPCYEQDIPTSAIDEYAPLGSIRACEMYLQSIGDGHNYAE